MKNRISIQLAFLAAALLLGTLAQPATAQVTFHTDLTSFQAAGTTTIQSTFESFPPALIPSPFSDGSVVFHQPPGNVPPTTSSQINPDALSNVLATNGNEDIDLTFLGPASTAVGWDAYTNQFDPPVVTVFDTSDNLIATYTLTQAPNTIGFVGITSTIPIGRVHWLADRGGIEHTALDNVRVGMVTPHKLKFFLHGDDIPETAGGFTMNQTPAPPQTLSLNLANAPSWFSDPPLTGTFQPGASFKLVIPCAAGLTLATTFRLAATNPDGSSEQLLGETTQVLSIRLSGEKTISIPVNTPVTLTNRRLKLTISSAVGLNVSLQIGKSSYLQTTKFVGTPYQVKGRRDATGGWEESNRLAGPKALDLSKALTQL